MRIMLAVFGTSLLVFHLLERWLTPVLPDAHTGPRRAGWRADLLHALVNGPGLSALTKVAAAWALLRLPGVSVMAGWHVAAQFAAYFIVNDLGRYWLHRLYHYSDLLWRIHRVHHSTVEMDSLSLLRIHVLEAVIKNFALSAPFAILGVDRSVIIAYSCIDIVKGFWHHANFRTSVGWLNYLINTAELHWWHHSVERRGHRSNYGSILSLWDWVFGTAYWPKGEWPDQIGVKGMENFSPHYVDQLLSIRYTDAELREMLDKDADEPEILPFAAPAAPQRQTKATRKAA